MENCEADNNAEKFFYTSYMEIGLVIIMQETLRPRNTNTFFRNILEI